tara:strand:- start:51 stop:1877 length:1827 start_codon:yes stop_codon:yes gene_type:complete
MSLVICSNTKDDSSESNTQSIFKPYSFRNGLSSTLTIPKNGQIALQSVKYNLDGTIAFAGDDYLMYQYYGESMGDGDDINEKSTSVPIPTPLISSGDVVEELTSEELMTKLARQLNNRIFHPQLRNKVSTDIKRNTATNELEGYIINYDYHDSSDSLIPSSTFIEEIGSSIPKFNNDYSGFEWDGSSFTTIAPVIDNDYPRAGILTKNPISLHNGVLTVDFSATADKEWAVGLSRYVNHINDDEYINPSYFSWDRSDEHLDERFFYDVIVCRDGDELKIYHTPVDSSLGATPEQFYLCSKEMVYGNDAVSYPYDLSTNSDSFTKVKFTCSGQEIKIEMLDATDTATTLYEYDSSNPKEQNIKMINQAMWNMYPVLYIEATDEDFGESLLVEEYTAVQTVDSGTDIFALDNSWYNFVEESSDEALAQSLEARNWNDMGLTPTLVYKGILTGSNQVIDLENYLITKPDDTFKPSTGANSSEVLGFNLSPTDDYEYGSGSDPSTRRTFTSKDPKMLSAKTIFLRVENLASKVMNAFMGNRSNIIAHLPRFDGQVETGRIYHEPKNLIFLDIGNSEPITINSFDISFCYSNEQYCTALTGQSVVVLYIKGKD